MTACGKGRPRPVLWCAALAAGVICALCAGTRESYASVLQLYRCILLPAVLAAALALALGALRYSRRG